jgi:hypothetical protein
MIGTNLGTSAAPVMQLNGRLLFANSAGAGQSAQAGTLQAYCTVAFLKPR